MSLPGNLTREQMLELPAAQSPTGVNNFDNPDNQNDMVVGLAIASLVVTTVLAVARLYSRAIVLRNVRIEDWLALIAYGNFVGLCYILIKIARSTPGWFVHLWDFRVGQTMDFSFNIHVGSNLITAVILCMKSAILLEWVHIFVPAKTRNAFWWTTWTMFTINGLFYLSGIFAENFSCRPYRSIWDKTVPGYNCIDVKALFLSSAVLDAASSLAVLILPHMVIWRLQMGIHKKLGVSFLFVMGIFGCVCSGFRVASSVDYYHSKDATYSVCGVAVWALGEQVSLFLVFCFPAIPKTFSHAGIPTIIRSLTSRRRISGGSSSGNKGSDSSGSNNVPMGNIPAVKRTESTEHLKDDFLYNDGIMRTMQVDMSVRDVDSLSGFQKERRARQHPWMSER